MSKIFKQDESFEKAFIEVDTGELEEILINALEDKLSTADILEIVEDSLRDYGINIEYIHYTEFEEKLQKVLDETFMEIAGKLTTKLDKDNILYTL